MASNLAVCGFLGFSGHVKFLPRLLGLTVCSITLRRSNLPLASRLIERRRT